MTESNLSAPQFPPGDYVSPGLKRIKPDAAFPFMTIGNPAQHPWPFLRREIPHNWYADRRSPDTGFVSRDEAHILYNTALLFEGSAALEVGCWLGWSTCHLALAGVRLDVVDPLLANPDFHGSVAQSLIGAGVRDRVRLFPGSSPDKVFELAALLDRRWPLIFIDGSHERPAPLNDAKAAHIVAAADALVLFHDLASPDVEQGLAYLRDLGWNTLVYQTMQIMAAAWRGRVTPIPHVPDPAVAWPLPDHLRTYRISGVSS
jgi:predicted O-methyltransferase YrrM